MPRVVHVINLVNVMDVMDALIIAITVVETTGIIAGKTAGKTVAHGAVVIVILVTVVIVKGVAAMDVIVANVIANCSV